MVIFKNGKVFRRIQIVITRIMGEGILFCRFILSNWAHNLLQDKRSSGAFQESFGR